MRKKYPSAIVAKLNFEELTSVQDGGPFFVTIGEYGYLLDTTSLVVSLYEALEMFLEQVEEVDEKKDIPLWLTASSADSRTESFFVPALLCGLNYITVEDFVETAVKEALLDGTETEHDAE